MDPWPQDRGQAWVLSVLERFEVPLLRYAQRIAPDPDTARDVVQYAFLRLCQEVRRRGDSRAAASHGVAGGVVDTASAGAADAAAGSAADPKAHGLADDAAAAPTAAPHIRNVGQWLYTVCRNRVVDLLRKEKRMHPLDALTPEPDGSSSTGEPLLTSREPSPDAAAESLDSCALVRGVLQTLPAAQQEVVQLWAEGFSYLEIGRITQRTQVNVRVTIHRALRTLREHPRIERLLAAYSAAPEP
jgi:RNA polymerase sigma factor (sigma-70 family)